MNSNLVGWFEISVQDMPRAKAFYTNVFSVQFEDMSNGEMEMSAFPMDHEAPGAGGALVKTQEQSSGGNSVLIYFSCEDCAVTADKAAKAGGQIAQPKTSIGEHGFYALVIDSESNTIGLHSMA